MSHARYGLRLSKVETSNNVDVNQVIFQEMLDIRVKVCYAAKPHMRYFPFSIAPTGKLLATDDTLELHAHCSTTLDIYPATTVSTLVTPTPHKNFRVFRP